MDWQQFVSLSIVAAAAAVFIGKRFQRRKFSFERDTHCGCSAAGHPSGSQSTVIYRARKGHRPEIQVKMK